MNRRRFLRSLVLGFAGATLAAKLRIEGVDPIPASRVAERWNRGIAYSIADIEQALQANNWDTYSVKMRSEVFRAMGAPKHVLYP